ncbi:hypothetical protein C7B61_15990 [filamentous cyanobacterium CCP1]|nr:hypothetical protein C7B76_30355 [filamentous cyanobacterium CCP2]PSB61412.1 hypothetical protein C7B61_15990 [filamentous cyanobacterium CCP1]
MPQLTPLRLDDGTLIYIEASENITIPSLSETDPDSWQSPTDEPRETTRSDLGAEKGWQPNPRSLQNAAVQSFQAMESTIRAYTTYSLSAFKQMTIAKVDKVTLEFGIEVGGEAGVPYVTKGTATSNLKITVECSFPNSEKS